MANQTVYPYGTGGSLPSSVGIVNDLTTGGADKALSAEQGTVLRERLFVSTIEFWRNSSSASWLTGNITNGTINPGYANKYIIISNFPAGVTKITVTRTAPDSNYYLGVYGSTNGTSFVFLNEFSASSATRTYTLGDYNRIAFMLYDKPSTERAQQEGIVITYETEVEVLNEGDVVDNLASQSVTKVLSANQGRILDGKISGIIEDGLLVNYQLSWVSGNINTNTGVFDPNYANKSTTFIPIAINKCVISNQTSYTVNICCYSSDQSYIGYIAVSPETSSSTVTVIAGTAYVRLCAWDKPSDSDVANITMGYEIESLLSLQESIESLSSNGIFNNPVLRADKPDPTIWDGEDGYFYLYATGNFSNNRMYRSANLYEWELTGDAPMNDTEALKVATAFGASSINQGFWAPHVYKINPTTWNLYISKPSGGIAILTSHHPTRGYEYVKFITSPSGAGEFIDAEIGFDMDGKVWMYTGGKYSIYRREMTADGLDWADGSSFELCAGMAFNASGNTNREKTFEGPYLYRRKGYWYLFCSSGLYAQGNYKLRVVRSQTLGGTWVDQSGNSALDGYAETVLVSAGTTLTGPGHNAPIFVDSNNDTWILYHSHWSGFQSSSTRGVCLDKVEWDEDGWPFINDGKPSVSHEVPSVFR